MHDCRYLAVLTDDPDGCVNATFPDGPIAITFGEDRADALRSASEALGLALRGYLANGRAPPEVKAIGEDMVSPYLDDILKIAFVDSFRQSNMSREEFSRLAGLKPWKAEALLDPDAAHEIAELENALTILGRRLRRVVEAA
ncbi:MAG: type II toxin-antitoxin system HicB family antitoxin [Rhizobiaceae bacterium]|nr:type II toxin-antitoxin system HicB family antitoxin [Rhizobiaceae bacterium]